MHSFNIINTTNRRYKNCEIVLYAASVQGENSSKELIQKIKLANTDNIVDVLIIGGGMTGINTFYQLKDSTLEVLLVEQNKIGMGVTVNSTGKLTYLQDNLYEKIKKSNDEVKAKEYLESQRDAIRLAVDIISKENIDCNLISAPSYVYSLSDKMY